MRDNFSEKTKSILASRVAYRCSFPGCSRITIGPGTKNNEHVILIGEAAHIYSAAPNGPRNNPTLNSEYRSSVDNGIWMCKSHARLIDVDETNYSAETLAKWKIDAENFVRERLETLDKEILPPPLTLIMLHINLVIKCRWLYVHEETWKFQVYEFVEGSFDILHEHLSKLSSLPEQDKYVVVESQGDGRVLSSLALHIENDGHVLVCELLPKIPRTNPHQVGGDLALSEDGDDLWLEDGDLKMVSGLECALQIIRVNLSWQFGWWANPGLGSNFADIYRTYHQNKSMLNSMVKLELVRLLTVPAPQGLFADSSTRPELSFINRINWVNVEEYDSAKTFLPLTVSLEWGNNENWQGQLKIPFSLNRNTESEDWSSHLNFGL